MEFPIVKLRCNMPLERKGRVFRLALIHAAGPRAAFRRLSDSHYGLCLKAEVPESIFRAAGCV